jgi:hypothetical protein
LSTTAISIVHVIPPETPFGRFARRFGINPAMRYAFLTQSWILASRPINLLIVVGCLTLPEQGTLYTFMSLLAFQGVMDMGLGLVVQQTASHEFAKLRWGPKACLIGDPVAKSRVASLLRQAVVVYTGISVILLGVLLSVGWLLLSSRSDAEVQWQVPWILVTAAAAMTFAANPLTSVLNGCGRMADTNRLGLGVYIFQSLTQWAGLLSSGLTGYAFASAVNAVTAAALTSVWFRRPLLDLLRTKSANEGCVSWRRELWPFQSRMAVSLGSHYLTYQLTIPTIYATFGPAVAGRVGFSLALFTQVAAVAQVWLTTHLPEFGVLIARREFGRLNRLFYRILAQSTAVCAAGSLVIILVAALAPLYTPWLAERLLDPALMLLPALTILTHHLNNAAAGYLRSHRREPLVIPSVVFGAVMTAFLWLSAPFVGVTGILGGIFLITLVFGLGATTFVFVTAKWAWHSEPSVSIISAAK